MKAVLGALAGDVEPDRLDRERPLDEGVEGLVDGPHRPEAEGPRDLVAPDRGREPRRRSVSFRRSSIRSRARSLPTLSRASTTVAPLSRPVKRRDAPKSCPRMGCGYAILVSRMPGPAVEVVAYGALHQPLTPLFLDYLAGRAGGLALPRPDGFDLAAVAAAAERVGRPRAADGGRGRGPRAPAGGARGEGRPSARAPSPSPGRRRSSPASRPASSAVRSSSSGRPWRRSGWRGSSRSSAGTPVVPVFWVASDDHDFAEIRSTSVDRRGGAIRTLRYAPRHEPVGAAGLGDRPRRHGRRAGRGAGPGAARGPGPRRDPGGRGGVLPPRRDALGGLRAPRLAPAARARGARPADAALKRLMVPVLARELREGSPTSRLALEAGRALLAAGYHQQVPVRPGFLNLFAWSTASAARSRLADGVVEVRGTRERWPSTRRCGASRPTRSAWSPGALLRPLVQDALLPTAAYVGGPRRDRVPRADRALVRALRHPPPGAAAPAEPHPRRAAAGAGPRGRAADPRRPGGRPRGARLALGARGLPRRRGRVRAGARGDRAGAGGGRGGARRARPDAARGHRLGPRPRPPPGGGAPREGAARAQEARPGPRGAPAADARRAAARRLAAGAGARARGRPGPARPAFVPELGERLDPFARGHQVVRL